MVFEMTIRRTKQRFHLESIIDDISTALPLDIGESSSVRISSEKMVQNYVLIWIDANIDETNNDCQRVIDKLRRIIYKVITFTDVTNAIRCINAMDDRKAMIIVSDVFGLELVPTVHHLAQVDTIYIFCGNKQRYKQWAYQWPKIQGIYSEIRPICKSLQVVAHHCDYESMPMSFVSKCTKAVTGLEQHVDYLDTLYMYTTLFKEIILEMNEDETISVKNLVAYARRKGIPEDNLAFYEAQYSEQTALWWYTSDSFIYSLLNRALRLFDMETMVIMGFFIRKLHHELEQLHSEQCARYKNNFIVYRGQSFSPREFQHLKNMSGGLMAFNCFLSTSLEQDVAMNSIETNLGKYDSYIGILFIITIDPIKINSSITPFASIDKCSAFARKNEILFSINTVFRVTSMKQSTRNDRINEVYLTITDESDPQLHYLTEYMTKGIDGDGWYRIGQLMLKLGHFDEAALFYNQLFESATSNQEKGHIYHELGRIKHSQGKYGEAIGFYDEALKHKQKFLKDDDLPLTCVYDNIAIAFYALGDCLKAVEYYEKSIKIKENSPFSPKDSLASSYNNIGVVHSCLGHNTEALDYVMKALEIFKETLPSYHLNLASSYNSVGQVYHNMNDFTKALEYFEKSLDIKIKCLPLHHHDLALSCNHIGQVYNNMGQYSEAIEYYEEAFQLLKQTPSTNHTYLAATYSNIGSLYHDIGDYSKALECYQTGTEIMENYHSSFSIHPDLANSYSNLGNIYSTMGDYSKALEYYEKSLNLRRKALYENHPDLATSFNNIGMIYFKNGEFAKALEYFGKDLQIMTLCMSSHHPDLAFTYLWLGRVHRDMRDYQNALVYFETSIEITKQSRGENCSFNVIAYSDVANLYCLMGDYEKAFEYHGKAFDIQETSQTINLSQLATIYVSLGETYIETKVYEEAFIFLQEAFEIYKKKLPEDHPALAVLLHDMARLYRNTGDYHLASENVRQAIKICQTKLPSTHPCLVTYKNTNDEIQDKLKTYS